MRSRSATSGCTPRSAGRAARVGAYGFDGADRWTLTMDGDPQAITVLGGIVYIGGHFDNVCRSTRTGDRGRLPRRQRAAGQAARRPTRTAARCWRGRPTATGPAACTRWRPARGGSPRAGRSPRSTGRTGRGWRSSAKRALGRGQPLLQRTAATAGGRRAAPRPAARRAGTAPARPRRGGSTSRRCRRTAARCRSAGGRRCWRCRCGRPAPSRWPARTRTPGSMPAASADRCEP